MKTLNHVNVQKATVKLQANCRSTLKIYPCPQCGSNFDRASQLDYHHRSIHLGERSHICQICEKGFFRKADLRTHLNIHLGTNFYICEVCGRKFSHVSNLIRHCRMHTGIKPYSCSICDKCFTQISSLARHKQMIHGIPKEQQYCNPSLVKKSQSQSSSQVLKENKDQFAEIAERLGFTDVSLSKTNVSNSVYDTFNNHEQTQFKDNKVSTNNFEKDNFTYLFLPRDRGPNAESDTPNDENILATCYTSTCIAHENCKDTSINNMEMNFQLTNEVSESKFLQKQMCAEISDENKKCNKSLNDNNSQMYVELYNSGIVKVDESKYCSDTVSLDHVMKSQHLVNIAGSDNVTCAPAIAQNQDTLSHKENLDSFSNSSNVLLNNEEPMLRLVQTETGEQFYEFVISNLVEKIQNASCTKDTENKIDEPSNFRDCQKIAASSKESNEKNDQMDQQRDLESFTEDFNYTQFDFHGEEKNFTILCDDDESENFQRHSKENECGVQDKGVQAYKSEFLELLENDLHVDFDKYVETNLEAFEKLSYENCNRFLELVEVADLGIESSEYGKESSMIRLIQNAGEQLLELFQDSQITEQESNQDFIQSSDLDKDCSNILQDGTRVADCQKNKPDLFTYIEDNMTLEENVSNGQVSENVEEHAHSNNHAYTDATSKSDENSTNNENSVKLSEETKRPKATLKKFQCSECKKAFSTAYNYKQHIGIHFTDQQKFHCKTCGLSFAWKSTLSKHIANVHSPDGPQKFACDICPKVYSTLSQVNEHVKRDHLKQRDHMCLHCGKCFFKKFDLKTHSRTHTNERPYVCRVCGRSFHHQSHIIRHERTHSSERPFVCDICQKTFAQSNSLRAHRQKHQQIRLDFLDCQMDEDDPVALAL